MLACWLAVRCCLLRFVVPRHAGYFACLPCLPASACLCINVGTQVLLATVVGAEVTGFVALATDHTTNGCNMQTYVAGATRQWDTTGHCQNYDPTCLQLMMLMIVSIMESRVAAIAGIGFCG